MMGFDLSSLLPELTAWLRKDPAHRAAFAKYRIMEEVLRKYARSDQPGAGIEEFRELLDAGEKYCAQSRQKLNRH